MPQATLNPYGLCPHCRLPGVLRELRPDGNDKCAGGHVYPSRSAIVDNALEATDEAIIARLRDIAHTMRSVLSPSEVEAINEAARRLKKYNDALPRGPINQHARFT